MAGSRRFETLITLVPKSRQLQANLFCQDCKLRTCNEQALGCLFRLHTVPNAHQKRKAANDARREEKRAGESPRTRYWREWKQDHVGG